MATVNTLVLLCLLVTQGGTETTENQVVFLTPTVNTTFPSSPAHTEIDGASDDSTTDSDTTVTTTSTTFSIDPPPKEVTMFSNSTTSGTTATTSDSTVTKAPPKVDTSGAEAPPKDTTTTESTTESAAPPLIVQNLPAVYEIVFPEQIRHKKRIGISTRDDKGRRFKEHYQYVVYTVSLGGHRHKLQLQLNQKLLSPKIQHKHFLEGNTQVISKDVEHCYYHGHVKKTWSSSVAVSTCNGIRGVIHLENATYVIAPLDDASKEEPRAHVVFQTLGPVETSCGNDIAQWQSYTQLHRREFLHRMKTVKAKRVQRNIRSETKYIELGMVLDHSMSRQTNLSQEQSLQYALEIGNIMDLYYKPMNIRVALTYIEVWNQGNQISVSSNVRQTLQEFMVYREQHMKSAQIDVAQLITMEKFEHGMAGMAVPDSVCTARAVGVNHNPDFEQQHQVASTVAHMIGHNLGLSHDDNSRQCSCGLTSGCIMGQNIVDSRGHHPSDFSQCSEEDLDTALQTGLGWCLFESPKEPAFPQYCGNSFVERGEECDCGPPELCANTDPCCDATTCLLKPWARCKSGPCCHNCTVRTSVFKCREASNECDVPEFCDGIHGECPSNAYVQDGQPCSAGNGYCFHGRCPSKDQQCQNLWGEGSSSSAYKCYEVYNPTGGMNGHCGRDASTGEFWECDQQNVQCGLLHCQGGQNWPLKGDTNLIEISRTIYGTSGQEYECKTANGAPSADVTDMGLVEEGTKCAHNRLCVNRVCVHIDTIIRKKPCPKGLDNRTCSGHGVCTTKQTCHCDTGWSGTNCSAPLRDPDKPTTPPIRDGDEVIVHFPPDEINTAELFTTTVNGSAVLAPQVADSGDTVRLVIILVAVTGCVVVVLVLAMLCYRRKSPASVTTKWFGKKKTLSSKHSESSAEEGIVRIIKFGNMPSYRQDKLDERKKRRKKSPLGIGSGSESETPHISADDQTDIKIVHNNLSKTPERGILKNGPRSSESLQNIGHRDDSGRGSRESRKPELSPSDNEVYIMSDDSRGSGKRLTYSHSKDNFDVTKLRGSPVPPHTLFVDSNGDPISIDMLEEETPSMSSKENLAQTLMSQIPKSGSKNSYREVKSDPNSPYSPQDRQPRLGEENLYDNQMSPVKSGSEEGLSSKLSSSPKRSPQRQVKSKSRSRENLPDRQQVDQSPCREEQDGGSGESGDSLGKQQRFGSTSRSRIIKLRNLEDLIKQIDQQESNNLSPANSEDFRCSEPEADRHFRKGQFSLQETEPVVGNGGTDLDGFDVKKQRDSIDSVSSPASPQYYHIDSSPNGSPNRLSQKRRSFGSGGAFREISPQQVFRPLSSEDSQLPHSVSPDNHFRPVSPPKTPVRRVSPEYGYPAHKQNQFRPIAPARISYETSDQAPVSPSKRRHSTGRMKSRQKYV
ncbi:disintegrin and metalloproteinase domain-containing protein unc-71-like isoform X2 [Lingula anatina]|uniref:Disintegrin and metalloproteinase domain-containing protein unc-71-like isoform X2 n=1 Tax=Lingula anatina TaxID=7574 RepID=A0A2R2MP46_LINAN|nr:disintegrin and metalloproteinase domain-containing protein unc-71-like isoform X2 [Lingula anatina]|eukprot:XP_023932005.1 disintegrin and metalloproteinase domain-containing protein unc-71-like isoform X2 [Lingula anatina]